MLKIRARLYYEFERPIKNILIKENRYEAFYQVAQEVIRKSRAYDPEKERMSLGTLLKSPKLTKLKQ